MSEPITSEKLLTKILKVLNIQPELIEVFGQSLIDKNKNGKLDSEEVDRFKSSLISKVNALSKENKTNIITILDEAGPVHPFRDEVSGKVPLLGLDVSKETADEISKTIRLAADMAPVIEPDINNIPDNVEPKQNSSLPYKMVARNYRA